MGRHDESQRRCKLVTRTDFTIERCAQLGQLSNLGESQRAVEIARGDGIVAESFVFGQVNDFHRAKEESQVD